MKKNIFIFLVAAANIYQARAQLNRPWSVGLKSGLATGGVSYAGSLEDTGFIPFLSLTAGYHPKSSVVGFHLDIQGEQRMSTNFAFSSALDQRLYYLIVPTYLRVGPSNARIHGIVGGFYGQCLSNPSARTTTYQWALRRREWGGLLGLDVKVIERAKFNLVLGAVGRWGFTPMFQAENPRYFSAYANSRFYALTLTSFFQLN